MTAWWVAYPEQGPFDETPVGSVLPYLGTTPPADPFEAGGVSLWLLCNGQAVSRTDYAELFALIGTTFGAGDGSTTFNVPDLRGRVPVGLDSLGGTPANRITDAAADALGGAGGAESVALTEAQLPAHTHGDGTLAAASGGASDTGDPSTSLNNVMRDLGGGGNVGWVAGSNMGGVNLDHHHTTPNHTHDVTGSTGPTGSGSAHSNVQPYLALGFIVRAKRPYRPSSPWRD